MIVNEKEIYNSDRKMEVEELSENLFILLTNIKLSILKTSNEWNKIYSNIQFITNSNLDTNSSISHKTLFKHMDILDKINK